MKMNYEDIENRVFFKKYELKDLTPSNIKKFIIDNLFEEQKPLNIDSYKCNIKNSTSFEPILHLQSIEYRISNTVLKEIYSTLRFLIEELNPIEHWEINIIEANVDARYTNEEKIEYLKEKRKELYLSIQNQPEYYVYLGERDFNGFGNWKDYIFDILLHDEKTVIRYLTEEIDVRNLPDYIYIDWLKFYKITEIINICENKINELSEEKKDSSIKKIDLSFQLALLEQIMKLENWDDISASKKGMILTNLIGKNKDNIKDYYNESIKKVTDIYSKFL